MAPPDDFFFLSWVSVEAVSAPGLSKTGFYYILAFQHDGPVFWLQIRTETYKSLQPENATSRQLLEEHTEQFVFLGGFSVFLVQSARLRIWRLSQRAPEAAGGPIDTQHASSPHGASMLRI